MLAALPNYQAITGRRLVQIVSFGLFASLWSCGGQPTFAQIIELAPPSQLEPPILEFDSPALLVAKQSEDKSPSDAKRAGVDSSNLAVPSPISPTNTAPSPATTPPIPKTTPADSTVVSAPELSFPTIPNIVSSASVPTSLGARELACCAASRWQPAIGLKQRAQTVQKLYSEQKASQRQAAGGIIQFLCLQAYHQEDLAAATVMRAYYTRIGIALQQHAISAAVDAIELQNRKQDRLLEQGLPAGVDLSSLDRQRLDLQEQSLQAAAHDDQLRRLISAMTGVDYLTDQISLEPLIVEGAELDCDALVAIGLRDRYDLQAWRCLCRSINEESAPLLASLIATSAGSYGIPLPKMTGLKTLLCSDFDKELLAKNLRQEVATIIATNESYAQQLIVEKCSQLNLAYQRWDLQKQRITSWKHRLKQIERLESHGDVRPADRATAEAGLLKAKSDEIARRMDAKLAEVNLAEVLGGLAGKCCRGEAWLTR